MTRRGSDGLRLDDGRRVVLKAHRPEASVDHLASVQHLQTSLADGSFPAPRPLLGPTPLGHGVAVVETLLDAPDAGRKDS